MLPLTPDAPTPPVPESGFAPMLGDSSPRYVASMRDGAVFVLFAMVVNVAATLGVFGAGFAIAMSSTMATEPPEDAFALIDMAHALLMLVAGAAGVIGWWWLTTRDPQEGSFAHPSRSRPVVRFAVIAQAALFLLLSVGPAILTAGMTDATPESAVSGALGVLALVGIASLLIVAIKFFTTMSYLRWLASRIPDETIDESAARFMWLGPLLVTVGALIIVGPLIALIMYWNLVFKTWKGLSEIALDQRDKAELAAAARHNMAA